MPALLTLTPNPALDLATNTERVAPTHKRRCGPVRRFAGGGGINVARVLHRLGADVQAWALAGGAAGAQVRQLLADEGVATALQPIAGDTRENFSAVETGTGEEFRFVLPGPTLQAAEWQACLAALRALQAPPRCCTQARAWPRPMTCSGWCRACPHRWRSPPIERPPHAGPEAPWDNHAFRNFYLGTGPFGPQAR